MIVVFLGPPGSGKGTQASRLKERYGFTHFDTGSRLRTERDSGSELGRRIAAHIDKGNLVPLEIIEEILDTFLATESEDSDILFDGFPRNLEQANVLESSLGRMNRKIDHVVFLEMEFDLLLERIRRRRELENRDDDTDEVFANRLEVYSKNTVPLLERYGEAGLLRMVSGNQSIDSVATDVTAALGLKV